MEGLESIGRGISILPYWASLFGISCTTQISLNWAQIVNRKYDTNDLEDLLECSGSYLITSLNNAYTNLKNGYCTIAFKIQLFGTVKSQVNS